MRALLRSRDLRAVLLGVTLVTLWITIREAIDFDGLMDANPIALIAYRLFAILVFGAFGIAFAFWFPRYSVGVRSLLYRLWGVLLLGMAAFHAWMLITGRMIAELMA